MLLDSLDASLFKALNVGLNVPLLDPVMVFITNYNYIVFLGLFLLFLRYEGKQSFVTLILALASFGLADWTGAQLKDLFTRPRPCQSLDEIVLLVKCTGLSMPSNHAANSFAFALPFIIMSKKRLRWMFLGFAAMVAYSRVYVGVHYPGDITVGGLLGSAVGIGMSYIYSRFNGGKLPESDDAAQHQDQSPTS